MLVATCLISSCDNLKGLKITQLDTEHNLANTFEVVEVDKKQCKITTKDLPPITLLSPEMQGAFCLVPKEFARYKKKLIEDCKNSQVENDISSNPKN